MTKPLKYYFSLFTIILITLCISTAVYAKTDLKTIAKDVKNNTIQFNVDMNGDGKADKFLINITLNQADSKDILKVKMNGKQVLYITPFFSTRYTIQYFALSSKAQFLYIVGRGGSSMPMLHSIFRYDPVKKKMVRALNFEKYLGTAGLVTKVTSKSIYVSNGCGMSVSGRINWTFIFDYSTAKKKFNIHSTTATAKCTKMITRNDGYDSYFEKNLYVVEKSFNAFTGVKLQKVAYTAQKNEIMQLKKIRLYKNGLYLQFRNSVGKTGWVHGYQKYGTGDKSTVLGTVFAGVMYRLAGGFYG